MFCALNGHDLDVPTDEAVTTMLSVAADDLDEAKGCRTSECLTYGSLHVILSQTGNPGTPEITED